MQTALLQWSSMAPGLSVVPGDDMATLTRFDLDAWVTRSGALDLSAIAWEEVPRHREAWMDTRTR